MVLFIISFPYYYLNSLTKLYKKLIFNIYKFKIKFLEIKKYHFIIHFISCFFQCFFIIEIIKRIAYITYLLISKKLKNTKLTFILIFLKKIIKLCCCAAQPRIPN